MLDYFAIISTGGLILWHYMPPGVAPPSGSPVNKLISEVLSKNRGEVSKNLWSVDNYSLKWLRSGEHDLLFVAVYQKALTLMYVDTLLDVVRTAFCGAFESRLSRGEHNAEFTFLEDFEKLQVDTEKNAKERVKTGGKATMAAPKTKSEDSKSVKSSSSSEATSAGGSDASELTRNIAAKGIKSRRVRTNSGKDDPMIRKIKVKPEPKSNKKDPRTWSNERKLTKKEEQALNRSAGEDSAAAQDAAMEARVQQMRDDGMMDELSDSSEAESDDEEVEEAGPGIFSRMGSMLKTKLGQAPLTEEDLAPALKQFQHQLISKNVAYDTAEAVCKNVQTQLVGQTLGTFTRVASSFKGALAKCLEDILTPASSIDILRGAAKAKKQGRPYVLVVCGVNGVGKSTSISKMCYFLKNNLPAGNKLMLSACDTFRAGAVEQLKVHARCLDVELYQEGYAKDAALVASAAIKKATEEDYDVVLVDTAGRMQSNGPLMAALAKLIDSNNPDLVLFVGEALAGNDAIDQVKLFNQALEDHSKSDPPRLIDGMVLTKFDTVDDKVGTSISMAYTTGSPIFFVGTGQRYVDLKRLNIKKVVASLLK